LDCGSLLPLLSGQLAGLTTPAREQARGKKERQQAAALQTKNTAEQLPIQPVDKPIICNPYEEPNDHWLYDKETGEASHAGHQRPAGYWYKTERVGSAQTPAVYRRRERRPAPRGWRRPRLLGVCDSEGTFDITSSETQRLKNISAPARE
jgi:hypothetical protein